MLSDIIIASKFGEENKARKMFEISVAEPEQDPEPQGAASFCWSWTLTKRGSDHGSKADVRHR
jgi:hypothetical protein